MPCKLPLNNVLLAGAIVAQLSASSHAAAPFATEVRALAHGGTRAPSAALRDTASRDLTSRRIDRSLILRSFDPSLKLPDPYRLPQRVNVRLPINW
jgi:hypothetical protein